MSYTVLEMFEALKDLVETYGEDWAGECPMIVGLQPNYPLQAKVTGLVQDSESERACNSDEEPDGPEAQAALDDTPEQIVICSGDATAYGEGWWWDAAA